MNNMPGVRFSTGRHTVASFPEHASPSAAPKTKLCEVGGSGEMADGRMDRWTTVGRLGERCPRGRGRMARSLLCKSVKRKSKQPAKRPGQSRPACRAPRDGHEEVAGVQEESPLLRSPSSLGSQRLLGVLCRLRGPWPCRACPSRRQRPAPSPISSCPPIGQSPARRRENLHTPASFWKRSTPK